MRSITWKWKKYSGIECLSTIFLLWWFWPLYAVILQIVIPERAVSFFGYLYFLLLFFGALYVNKGKMKHKFVLFICLYLLGGVSTF